MKKMSSLTYHHSRCTMAIPWHKKACDVLRQIHVILMHVEMVTGYFSVFRFSNKNSGQM